MGSYYRRSTRRFNPQMHLINHVVLVLDCSYSMNSRKRDVIQVADNEIQYLAKRSQELGQETRVSVYVFDDDVDCLVYDTDVLRLPSIVNLYEIGGNTALVDATMIAIEELSQTATLHGDHSFLIYVITDGQENASRQYAGPHLSQRINSIDENWTLACFVPDQISKRDAVQFGFQKDNVAIWDTSSVRGMDEVGTTVRTATESWMTGRSTGIRGTRTLFSTGAEAVNAQTVSAAQLIPLQKKQYAMLPVRELKQTRPFLLDQGYQYVNGTVHYLLMKTENIQAQKDLLVVEKRTNKVFAGPGARDLVGLPQGMSVKVKPDFNPEYDIYVQSTAPNRNLIPNTTCIVLNPIKVKT